jgi:rhamnose utilization protein RhaD (predicted bifunctional aldolase and dehydrogenase)
MQSRWLETEAQATIDSYAQEQIGRDLALRVYTARLLGRESRLVLHGGGNASVKTARLDLLGKEVEVLCVKGSGWDMAEIEPAGFPALRLNRLRELRGRAKLADEDMVRLQRESLLDPMAPVASVETLLHAFLPHKYVDHTHAEAVLSLVDQPSAEAICTRFTMAASGCGTLMPGFSLAQAAAAVYEAKPDVEGLILLSFASSRSGAMPRILRAYDRARHSR